ncbi:MAG: hypothetical protein AAB337_03215 [Patescibacteria group bacterium]
MPALASVTELLILSFLLYRRSAGVLIGYSSWLLLPLATSYVILVAIPSGTVSSVLLVLVNIILFVLSIWISVALMIVTANFILGQQITSDHVAQTAKKHLWPAIIVIVLVTIIKLIGFLLLLIPGIIVSVWYAFAQAEVVLDGKRWLDALSASRDLSRGRFWNVLWRLLGGALLLVGLYLFVVSLLANALIFIGVHQIGVDLLTSTISVLYLPIIIIYSVGLYLDLKRTYASHPNHWS